MSFGDRQPMLKVQQSGNGADVVRMTIWIFFYLHSTSISLHFPSFLLHLHPSPHTSILPHWSTLSSSSYPHPFSSFKRGSWSLYIHFGAQPFIELRDLELRNFVYCGIYKSTPIHVHSSLEFRGFVSYGFVLSWKVDITSVYAAILRVSR